MSSILHKVFGARSPTSHPVDGRHAVSARRHHAEHSSSPAPADIDVLLRCAAVSELAPYSRTSSSGARLPEPTLPRPLQLEVPQGTLMTMVPRVRGPTLTRDETTMSNVLAFRLVGMTLATQHLHDNVSELQPGTKRRFLPGLQRLHKRLPHDPPTLSAAYDALGTRVSRQELDDSNSRASELHALLRYVRLQVERHEDRAQWISAQLHRRPEACTFDAQGRITLVQTDERFESCLFTEPLAFFLRAAEAPPINAQALLDGYMQVRARRAASLREHLLLAYSLLLVCVDVELIPPAQRAGEVAGVGPYPSRAYFGSALAYTRRLEQSTDRDWQSGLPDLMFLRATPPSGSSVADPSSEATQAA